LFIAHSTASCRIELPTSTQRPSSARCCDTNGRRSTRCDTAYGNEDDSFAMLAQPCGSACASSMAAVAAGHPGDQTRGAPLEIFVAALEREDHREPHRND
jgi:hypothetical protein